MIGNGEAGSTWNRIHNFPLNCNSLNYYHDCIITFFTISQHQDLSLYLLLKYCFLKSEYKGKCLSLFKNSTTLYLNQILINSFFRQGKVEKGTFVHDNFSVKTLFILFESIQHETQNIKF